MSVHVYDYMKKELLKEGKKSWTSIQREDLDFIASKIDLSQFKGKRVLITGGYGMYLLYTTWSLIEAGAITYVNYNGDISRICERLGIYESKAYMSAYDLLHPVSFDFKLHFILHGASPASPHHFEANPVGTILPNTVGTWHLLELARKKKITRFVYISSSGISRQGGVAEPYYAAKRAGEALCNAYASQYGVPVSIIRPEHTFGPTMRLDDSRVFAQFLNDKVHDRPINMTSDGTETRLFQYVTDATLQVLNALVGLKHPPTYSCRSIAELKWDIEHEATPEIARTIRHFKEA